MQRIDIKSEEQIKTICEYLFFDQFQDTASFPRFEQCFQPLFNNINISMETVFKDICGEKKKYITYNRFAKAYLSHINGKNSSLDTKTFFNNLFSKILKEENSYIGNTKENSYTFSTVKSCKNRQCISLVEILSDKQGKIHGINLEYDGVFKSKMYPTKIEEELVVSLEMNLGIVDEKPIKEKKIGKFLGFKQTNYRDAVTHIFGTINKENGLITFLGFKCISGKTVFVGFPEGDGFLFGKFGNKFHDLKLQMTIDGITKLEPGFRQNLRKNFFLGGIFGKLLNLDLNKDEIIKDEAHLAKLKDDIAIDKLITTPIVEDDHFFNNKLKDEISGNDYKEVVNQFPRNWILRIGMAPGKKRKIAQKKFTTIGDALKGFNEEYENRAPSKLKSKSLLFPSSNIPFLPHGSINPVPGLGHFGNIGGPFPHFLPLGTHGGNENQKEFIGSKSINPIPRFIPWLHKTKAFLPSPRPGMFGFLGKKMERGIIGKSTPLFGMNKLNGKIEKQTPPGFFLYKKNFIGLKEKLGKMIHEDVLKKSKGNEEMKQILLSQIIPFPGRDLGRISDGRKLSFQNEEFHKNFLKMKNLRGEINVFSDFFAKNRFGPKPSKKIDNFKEKDINNKKAESNVIYSDALQILEDMSDKEGKEKGNIDNKNNIGFGENNKLIKNNNNYKNPFDVGYNNHGFNNFRNYNIKFSNIKNFNKNFKQKEIQVESSAPGEIFQQQFNNNYNAYNQNQLRNKENKKRQEENKNQEFKDIQEKWKAFRKGLEKINGVYLLQTIGSIIKAMKILNSDDNDEQSNISLSDKIKLYKMLEENEAIVNFLSKSPSSSAPINPEGDPMQIETEVEEEIDDNILIPDEHPEQFTSLSELQEKLDDIKKILDNNKKLKDEDRKKIEILYNLYLQQKNILIENETKSAKSEVIRQNNININKYLLEEQEKRKKAQEEEQKKLEQMQKEEENKNKRNILTKSILTQEQKTSKIYRNQKMPEEDKPWTDEIFPPEKKSLCPFNNSGWVLPEDVWESDVYGWENFKWCRVEEIYDSKEYTVFKGGSTMNDIQQGNIGDCYFLSVLGSLCAYPDFFDKLFHIKEKTKEHVYGVYIYINGKWELVLVDDYFPYEGSDFKQFAFSCSAENEIWVALLEKAWAKINGCYAKIGCGGLPNEVFDVLTEAYSMQKSISKNNKEEIWKLCEDSVGKGYVMTAGTSGDVSNLDLEEVGLSPAHAYSFLNIYKVNTENGIERVVKLRNPWGNGEYNGPWSDSSKKWTNSTKQQCNYKENSDDGVFYMSYDDFIKYYVTMGVAKLEYNYKTTVCKIGKILNTKCQILKLTVKEENKNSYIQLYQKNPRIILKDGTYQRTVLSFLMLVDENFKYIKSNASTDMHIGIEVDLKPGNYFVFCDVNYRYVNTNGKNHGYNVTCYAKNQILIENVTQRIDGVKALEVALYYYCRQKIENPTKDKSGMLIYISKNYNTEIPFMLACFVNPTSISYKVKLEVEAKGSKSFCIYNDSVGTENDSLVIKEIKSGSAATFSIMKYSLSSMFTLRYSILSSEDIKESEENHPVFEEESEQIDEDGNLFQYILEVNDGNGYVIGLENISKYKIKLKLVLEGLTDIDVEFKGKLNPVFDIMPKSKRIFNLRVQPDAEELSFEFTYAY